MDVHPTDLKLLVRGSKALLERLVGERVSMELDLSLDSATVDADPGQIEQVLFNLVINARDAMPRGGRLAIGMRDCLLSKEDTLKHPWVEPGEYVGLSVSDSGIGMDDTTLEHLFDPLFTTKGWENRAGLGLAVVYGIVKQHKGRILVCSEVGNGTTFHVHLPVTRNKPNDEPAVKAAEFSRGSETILLAEDEDTVRLAAKLIMEEHGYTVICANNGEEAVELFEQNADRIDLVILDLIMPKLGGRQAWQQISRRRPDLKVIFTSGYRPDTASGEAAKKPNALLLTKPFPLMQMVRTVRTLLDGPPAL